MRMNWKTSMRKTVLILGVLILLPQWAEAQCAMCRAVLESQESTDAAEGINNGIVYLMAIPYILIGGLGYLIYRRMKKGAK